MKLCAIQIPYGKTADQADSAVDFLIGELDRCDSGCDLILTPEYSNAPATFPPGGVVPYARNVTPRLIEAARNAARRCHAIVAVNYLCEAEPGMLRNTTRVFDRSGNIAGDYYKQHLPTSEIQGIRPDISYTETFRSPEIITVDGIRLGFLICYDTYFTEYIAHLAYCRPDIVLVSSFQRAERQDVLRMLSQSLAFTCNSFVLRASVSMGEDAKVAGTSMAVSPDGTILGDFGSRVGRFCCEIGNPHYKYMRTNAFGGKLIPNDLFVSQGRSPWSYRPCGSMTVLPEKQMGYPRLCAHRGFNTVAPENSLAAFGAAIALGAEEIELDVRFTRDGIPVVCHDDRLDRVSNGCGLVRDLTFEELRKPDAGIGFSSHYAGLKIASFEEVLGKFARHAVFNLHLKSDGDSYSPGQFRKIVELLRKYDQMEHVYLMADASVMKTALELAPEIPRCMAADMPGRPVAETAWGIVDRAVEFRCSKVQLFKPYFSSELIAEAHSYGILCNIFWSDDPAEAEKLFAMGADTVLTNDYLALVPVKEAAQKARTQ